VPAAPKPGNRERMEDLLGSELVEALRRECKVLGIPADRWHLVQSIAAPRETAAVVMLADRIQVTAGLGAKSAIERAAEHLGLEPDTMHSRLKRWHAAAYRPAA
jgi:hypothetical protein